MNLHYSQTDGNDDIFYISFSTLWIYTTLKHLRLPIKYQQVLVPYEFTLLSNLDILYDANYAF